MLIIPNATDTTGGNRYEALDQAEPDSLDFEVMGNTGRSGVVSGLAVTSNSSAANVNVAAGVIALNGAAYTVSASPTYALPSAPADNRFDLIIARVTAGVASLTTIAGVNSATNPTFPRSRSVLNVAFNASQHVDLDTDVVIAAVYRTGAGTITDSRILDKRAMQSSGIVLQGTDVPTSGVGSGPGNLYFKSNTTDGDGTDSGVYVKLSNGEWIGLAKDVGLHTPIGAMIEWPTANTVPDRFAEPMGQGLSTSTYATLFSIYGYEHGGSGATFLLPDFRDVYKRGTANTSLVGDSFGSDTVTLAINQLPPHTHPNPHSHTFSHTHGIEHTHTGNTDGGGAHTHSPGTLAINGVGGRNPMLREPTYGATNYATGYYTTGDGFVRIQDTALGDTGKYVFGGGMAISQLSQLVVSGSTASSSTHTHPYSIVYAGNTTSQSSSTTSPADVTPTGSTGSGSPVSLLPSSKYVRNIIRVA